MRNPEFNFEKLKTYQKSLDFIDYCYEVVKQFPIDERYGLTSQYRRASLSISLNIGEGHGDTDAQFNRYLKMAWDSVKECVVCSTVAKRQNYITEKEDIKARQKLEELSKMITSLMKRLSIK